MRTIALDWETFYDKECSVKTLGNWAYAHHPNFEAYMVSVFDGAEKWAGHPKDLCWEALDGCRLLSHNAGFDISVYMAEAERGNVPWLNIPSWHCTANMAVALCGYRDLKRSTDALLGSEFIKQVTGEGEVSKKVRGAAEGMRYKDFMAEEGRWDEMVAYATGDAVLCWHLWDRFSWRLSPLEHRMSDETVRLSIEGVKVDWALVDKYKTWLVNDMMACRNTLPWVAEGKAETSTLAIKDHCARNGIPVPPVKDDDEEGYEAWVARHKEKFPWVENISSYRKLNKMQAFLSKLESRRRTDDCIDANLLYFGGHTGRWAGALGGDSSGSGINLQNLRKKGLPTRYGEVHQRHVFVPKNGKFIIADYSQIEARVLPWLAGDMELLDMLSKQGMNIYEAHARLTMGWTGGDLKKAAETDKVAAGVYALAKARVLMLGYGAGWRKFKDTAFVYLKRLMESKEAKETVEAFRETNPLIVDFWYARDDEFKAIKKKDPPDNNYIYTLKSGRRLAYCNVTSKPVQETIPDVEKDPTGELGIMKGVFRNRYTARAGDRYATFYGGKLTENIVQATARDIFAEGLSRVLDKHWHVPFHVHDEVILDVDKSVTIEEVVDALAFTPPWAKGCPVGVDAHETDHYMKA